MGRAVTTILLLFFITACSLPAIVPPMDDIYPHRIVTVTSIVGGEATCLQMEKLIKDTNKLLTPQTGIILRQESCTRTDEKMGRNPERAGWKLYQMYKNPDTDIVIWAETKEKFYAIIEELELMVMMGQYKAFIDDKWRRYILLQEMNPLLLLHEIGHAFIFSHLHSDTGVMVPSLTKVLPFAPCLPIYKFSEEDRQEILKNKFRKFGPEVNAMTRNKKESGEQSGAEMGH